MADPHLGAWWQPLAPSDELQQRVRQAHDLAKDTRRRAQGQPKLQAIVGPTLEDWDIFYTKWQAADWTKWWTGGLTFDIDAANAQIASVNTAHVNALNFRPEGYDVNAKRVTPATDPARVPNVQPGNLSAARGAAVAARRRRAQAPGQGQEARRGSQLRSQGWRGRRARSGDDRQRRELPDRHGPRWLRARGSSAHPRRRRLALRARLRPTKAAGNV